MKRAAESGTSSRDGADRRSTPTTAPIGETQRVARVAAVGLGAGVGVRGVSERHGIEVEEPRGVAEQTAERFVARLLGSGDGPAGGRQPDDERRQRPLGRQRRVVPGSGRPLPPAVRHWAERGAGTQFDEVRVHTGGRAARLAGAMDARAYTVGNHVVFGSGEYRPGDATGRRLLAHELGHVAQRSRTIGRQQTATSADPSAYANGQVAPGEGGTVLIMQWVEESMSHERFVRSAVRNWLRRQFGRLDSPRLREALVATFLQLDPSGPDLEPGTWRGLVVERSTYETLVGAIEKQFGTGRESWRTEQPAEPRPTDTPPSGPAPPTDTASPESTQTNEERLDSAVEYISEIESGSEPPEQTAKRIALRLRGLDLAERETLERIANAVRSVVPAALPALLQEIEAQTGLLSDFAPLLEQSAEDLVAIVSGIENAGAFFEALLTAVGETDPETTKRLAAKLAASSVLSGVLSPVFLAGTAVKLAEDIWGLVELPGQVVEFIQNEELRATVMQVAEMLFHPDGRELARTFGTEAGRAIVGKLDRMSKLGVVEFTYELGKLLGPMLVEVVLAVLLPASVAATLFRRTVGVVRKLLKLLPDLPASVKKLLKRDGDDTRKIDRESDRDSDRESEQEPDRDSERESDRESEQEPDSESTPDPDTDESAPTPTPDVSVVKSRRDFDSDEAFEEYLVENHPNVGRDPDGHLYNTLNDRRLKIRESDGRVVNADTNHIAKSADPAYVKDDSNNWVLRPNEELPPHLRQRPTVTLAPSRRATDAQLDRVRESAPDWLTDPEYWPRVRDGLREADVDILVQAMETFGDRPGFDAVVRDLVSTDTFRTGARFALRYANERLDSTDLVSFERPDRFGYLKKGDEGLESALTKKTRVVDVRVYSEGKRVELKSWTPQWLQTVLDNPAQLRQQFRRDASRVDSPDQMRWVFDMSRFRANPQATQDVLGIPDGVELTPELVHEKLVEKLHDALAGDDILRRGPYRRYLGEFDTGGEPRALGPETLPEGIDPEFFEGLRQTEPYRQRLEELRTPGKLREIVEIAGDETP